MKIAWLTPLSPASAIGKVTAHVAEHLPGGAQVHLWCSDRGELRPTPVPIVRYTVSDAFERALREYDTVLYNFGDHYGFHRDVFLMSRRVPGIAILHDLVLHHFFMGYYFERPGRLEWYFDAMERLYGAEARSAAEASFHRERGGWVQNATSAPLWDTDRVVDYPLFEEALHNATGVVVHSDFLCEKARAATDAPVRRLRLPAVPAPAAIPASRETLDIPPGRAVLLTVGHVNPNKRIGEVVEALGQNPDLARRVLYVVIGELPPGGYAEQIRDAIARFGLESAVRLAGRRSDEELQAWLRHADVCLNLRHPVMEGASASLAEQLTAGKAAVVTNAGVYAETPDDCVRKIDPGREAEQLPTILRGLLDDPAARSAMANRGRAFAETHLRADRYAADLVGFIQASGGLAAMARYADTVGRALKHIGAQPGMPIVQTVARESADLFGEPITSPWRPGSK